jgi:hypothetical protein
VLYYLNRKMLRDWCQGLTLVYASEPLMSPALNSIRLMDCGVLASVRVVVQCIYCDIYRPINKILQRLLLSSETRDLHTNRPPRVHWLRESPGASGPILWGSLWWEGKYAIRGDYMLLTLSP